MPGQAPARLIAAQANKPSTTQPNNNRRRQGAKSGPVRRESGTIGFRLDEESHRVLSERANRLGISPHELARHYVIEMLHEAEERAALHEAIATLQQGIHKIREDVATTAEALLIAAGDYEAEEAHTWAAENFK